MDRATALEHLTVMRGAVQKARSDMREGTGSDELAESLNARIRPWLFGPKSILPKLADYIERVEKGAPIKGSEFYNFMWIINQEPIVGLVGQMWGNHRFPAPGLPLERAGLVLIQAP